MGTEKSRNRYHVYLTIYFGNLSTINNHLLYSYDAQVQVSCRTRMRRCDDAHDVRLPNWVVDSVTYTNQGRQHVAKGLATTVADIPPVRGGGLVVLSLFGDVCTHRFWRLY